MSFGVGVAGAGVLYTRRPNLYVASPASVLLVSDTFTGTNGDALGTTDNTGSLGALNWEILAGTWIITGNAAQSSVIGGGLPVASVAVVDVGRSDFYASYTHTVSDVNGQSLIFRLQDVNNFLAIRGDNTQCFFIRAEGGSVTSSATMSATLGAGTIVSVACSGSTIRCYLDGVLKATVTDTTYQTLTKVGIGAQGTGQRFDDFSVRTR